MNPRGTPRKNSGPTDTLTKRLTGWLTLRRFLRYPGSCECGRAHPSRSGYPAVTSRKAARSVGGSCQREQHVRRLRRSARPARPAVSGLLGRVGVPHLRRGRRPRRPSERPLSQLRVEGRADAMKASGRLRERLPPALRNHEDGAPEGVALPDFATTCAQVLARSFVRAVIGASTSVPVHPSRERPEHPAQ